jgi:hypothetical protein
MVPPMPAVAIILLTGSFEGAAKNPSNDEKTIIDNKSIFLFRIVGLLLVFNPFFKVEMNPFPYKQGKLSWYFVESIQSLIFSSLGSGKRFIFNNLLNLYAKYVQKIISPYIK